MVWGHYNTAEQEVGARYVIRLTRHVVSARPLNNCVHNKRCGSCEYQCSARAVHKYAYYMYVISVFCTNQLKYLQFGPRNYWILSAAL